MSNFELKTHQIGRTYAKPHFFILSKGLNSGKPLTEPCPNCFVLTVDSTQSKEALFYLCLALNMGQYFAYYLKGSVIPFIGIKEASNVLKSAWINYHQDHWQQRIVKLKKVCELEQNLKKQLQAISQLKQVLVRT